MAFIRAYWSNGFIKADIDPLKLDQNVDESVALKFKNPKIMQEDVLTPDFWGFSQSDLDRKFTIDGERYGGILATKEEWTLREIKDVMEKAYCGHIGTEFMHITDQPQRKWIRERMEILQTKNISKERKLHLLDRIYWTDEFSQFISTKFNTLKRFGLEGCESFIPGMKTAMDYCFEHGGEKAIIGMPHRGRLNILANVIRKPLSTIFAEFQGVMPQ